MPRPLKCRRIFFRPSSTFFSPRGIKSREENILTFPEAEAIRLMDLENLQQAEACKKMKISQPTLSRLLTSARKKLADSIINSKSIKLEGGVFKMAQPRGRGPGLGRGFGRGQGGRGLSGGFAAGPGGICKCPKCGHEEPQLRGQPCMNKKCPKCKTLMTRG